MASQRVKSWTPEDDQLLRSGIEAGESWHPLAHRVGVSVDAARKRAKKLGLTRPTQPGVQPSTTPRSLLRFVRDKRREGCPVCALSVSVRGQLAEASTKKIPRAVQLEWLTREVGAKISDTALSQHAAGRHDVQDAA